MSDFEDKSVQVVHPTDWGNWSQTVQDVTIEVVLEKVRNKVTTKSAFYRFFTV